MAESKSIDKGNTDSQLTTSAQTEIRSPQSEVVAYVPQSEARKVSVSRTVIVAALIIFALIPTVGTYFYLDSQHKIVEAEH